MSAYLSISSNSQYLFTEPFNVNRLHGVGCGTTGRMIRAEDLMFIYEAIREFMAYTNYLNVNDYPSERSKYDIGSSLESYENGKLSRPKNPTYTSISKYVNGPSNSPPWFDSKANLNAPTTEYSGLLPPEYQLFGLTESDCYHYSEIYYNQIESIMSSSRNLNADIIHGFYSGIATLHGMWFRCDVHGYSGKQIVEETKHKGGNGVDLSTNQDSYVYPVIEDYPEGEQHSEFDENITVPSFSNRRHLYSFSASATKKLTNDYLRHWNPQGYWEYDDNPTLSEIKSSYDYSLSVIKTKSGYPVRFWLWKANTGMFAPPSSFKVFAKMSHKRDGDTYYRIVDLSEKFSLSQDGGMFVLEGSIDGNDATEYFTNVDSPDNIKYPDDPPIPSPGNDSTTTAYSGSTIDLYELFAVVKPNFNATFTE